MRLRPVALAAALTLAVAACSGPGSTPSPSAPADSTSPAASAAARRVEVKLSDALRMEPAQMTVTVGQPVTFVVSNVGGIDHEFYLGDEAMQSDEEQMMQSGQKMADTARGITLKPGETKELTYTFDTVGRMLAGCHVAGHYGAGMKASITVTE